MIGLNIIIIIPLCMAVLFLFAFPRVSLALKSMQKFASVRLHHQAISIVIGKVNSRRY